jgi:hypothetical protein
MPRNLPQISNIDFGQELCKITIEDFGFSGRSTLLVKIAILLKGRIIRVEAEVTISCH